MKDWPPNKARDEGEVVGASAVVDVEQDTPELARLVRNGINSRSKLWKNGDSLKQLPRLIKGVKK